MGRAAAFLFVVCGLGCGPSVALTSASDSGSGDGGPTSADDAVSASGGAEEDGPTSVGDDAPDSTAGTTGTACADWGDPCDVLPCCDGELVCNPSSLRCLDPNDSGDAFIDGNWGDFGTGFECDLFAQDCPRGEKCMPWANDGGTVWNATRCSPVTSDPVQVGEPCAVEGNGVSGIDECDVGLMCWDVDPSTNVGTCVEMCQGNEADPLCADGGTTCAIANDGAIVLCLPSCHPLLQDCVQPDDGCYAVVTGDFVCAPNAGGGTGDPGDACAYINACNPGRLCLSPEAHSACAAEGCCTSLCSLTSPDPDADCAVFDAAQVCLPWYVAGMAPAGYEDVGICTVTEDATIALDFVANP